MNKLFLVAVVSMFSASAHAAVDAAGVVAEIGAGAAAVTAIGAAVLTVWGIKKVYSLITGR